MRYPGEHKAQTRAKVLAEASRALRANGVEGVSVKTIMDRAGLTHGGFYAHFASKSDLVAHAIDHMFDERYERTLKGMAGKAPGDVLVRFIDSYLSMKHRDDVDVGCPIPALATDAPRLSTEARDRLSAGARRLRDGIAEVLTKLEQPSPDELAATVVSELVGAIVTARAAADVREARRILNATKEGLKARLGLSDRNAQPPFSP